MSLELVGVSLKPLQQNLNNELIVAFLIPSLLLVPFAV